MEAKLIKHVYVTYSTNIDYQLSIFYLLQIYKGEPCFQNPNNVFIYPKTTYLSWKMYWISGIQHKINIKYFFETMEWVMHEDNHKEAQNK